MTLQEFPLFGDFYLSPVQHSDSQKITWAMNNEDITRTLAGPPYIPYEEKHAHEFIDSMEARKWNDEVPLVWVVRDRSKDDLFIGTISIRPSDISPERANFHDHIPKARENVPHKFATFGFYMDPAYQGKGLMSKSLEVMVHKIGHDIFGIKAFYGCSFIGNWASRRTFEKAGFRYAEDQLGAGRKLVTDEPRDLWVYELYLDDSKGEY
jgi:RimJ/RimL family protein N-acetyltransferase